MASEAFTMRKRHLTLAIILLCFCAGSLGVAGAEEDRPKRPPLPNPFGAPVSDGQKNAGNLGPAVNSEASDIGPIISPDGNALYFTSDRPGGMGGQDVWRPAPHAETAVRSASMGWASAGRSRKPATTRSSSGAQGRCASAGQSPVHSSSATCAKLPARTSSPMG